MSGDRYRTGYTTITIISLITFDNWGNIWSLCHSSLINFYKFYSSGVCFFLFEYRISSKETLHLSPNRAKKLLLFHQFGKADALP
jgi:hypothetical protein